MADNADVTQSQAANHHRLLSHVHQASWNAGNKQMCIVLRAEYCIVGSCYLLYCDLLVKKLYV